MKRVGRVVGAGLTFAVIAACGSGGGSPRALPSLSIAPIATDSGGAGPSATPTTATASSGACQNGTATAAVKAALVVADGRPGATEQPDTTFYGVCGSSAYAVASFEPSPSATTADSVAFQDHGAYPEFFVMTAGAAWKLVGSAAGPPGTPSCAGFSSAPASLRAIWGNCPSTIGGAPSPSASATPAPTQAASCADYAKHTFVMITAVTVSTDGGAALTAQPLTVHCGGPDDKQFNPQGGVEALTVAPGADIEVLDPSNSGQTVKTDPAGLKSSVAANQDGNTFEVQGPTDGLTSLVGQFHP